MGMNNYVLAVSNDDSLRHQVEGVINKFWAGKIALRNYSFQEIERIPVQDAPVLCLVDLHEKFEALSKTIQNITSLFSHSRIVGAGPSLDAQQILSFVKMGVKDFLEIPFSDEEFNVLLEDLISAIKTDKIASKFEK